MIVHNGGEMVKCSCGDPECGNYISTDEIAHMIFMTKNNPRSAGYDRENSMYLDPNSITALIKELRLMLAAIVNEDA